MGSDIHQVFSAGELGAHRTRGPDGRVRGAQCEHGVAWARSAEVRRKRGYGPTRGAQLCVRRGGAGGGRGGEQEAHALLVERGLYAVYEGRRGGGTLEAHVRVIWRWWGCTGGDLQWRA